MSPLQNTPPTMALGPISQWECFFPKSTSANDGRLVSNDRQMKTIDLAVWMSQNGSKWFDIDGIHALGFSRKKASAIFTALRRHKKVTVEYRCKKNSQPSKLRVLAANPDGAKKLTRQVAEIIFNSGKYWDWHDIQNWLKKNSDIEKGRALQRKAAGILQSIRGSNKYKVFEQRGKLIRIKIVGMQP